ncbi:unnamed protein product, partial [Meganyctiphanes norvegica]
MWSIPCSNVPLYPLTIFSWPKWPANWPSQMAIDGPKGQPKIVGLKIQPQLTGYGTGHTRTIHNPLGMTQPARPEAAPIQDRGAPRCAAPARLQSLRHNTLKVTINVSTPHSYQLIWTPMRNERGGCFLFLAGVLNAIVIEMFLELPDRQKRKVLRMLKFLNCEPQLIMNSLWLSDIFSWPFGPPSRSDRMLTTLKKSETPKPKIKRFTGPLIPKGLTRPCAKFITPYSNVLSILVMYEATPRDAIYYTTKANKLLYSSPRKKEPLSMVFNNGKMDGSEVAGMEGILRVRRHCHKNHHIVPGSNLVSESAEIDKIRKGFNSGCLVQYGVNLLIGTETGLMLLDRSGVGKVYQLISRRRFQQMEVLSDQNILVTISGKKNRVRVYYLSWLKSKILRTDAQQVERRNGWINVGDLHGAVHFKIVKYERIKFLVIALRDSIEIYAWAPKPYHKFMAFKSFGELVQKPCLVDLTVEEGSRLKVVYGSNSGFHAVDVDSGQVYDIYIPKHIQGAITPHTIVTLPNSNGLQLLICYDNEGVYVNTYGKVTKNMMLQWGEMPTSVAYIGTGQIMGWGNKAIEIRSVETGHLDGVFMHKKAQKLKFLCERNDKVFFSSAKGGSSCQIYFMTLNKPGMANW